MKIRLLMLTAITLALAGCSSPKTGDAVSPIGNDEMQKVQQQLDDLNKSGQRPTAVTNPVSEFIRNRTTKDCVGLAEVLDSNNSHSTTISALKRGDWQSVLDQGGTDKTSLIALAVAHYNLAQFDQCLTNVQSAKDAGVVMPALDELKGSAEWGLSAIAKTPSIPTQPAVVPASTGGSPAGTIGTPSSGGISQPELSPHFQQMQEGLEAMKRKDWAAAKSHLDQAGPLATTDEQRAMVRVAYIMLAGRQGKFDEAIAIADGIISANDVPENVMAAVKGMRGMMQRCRDEGAPLPPL